MRTWPILLTLFVAGTAAAVPIWKWVDASGQAHYTDVPVPGATRIELTGVQSVPAFHAGDASASESASSGSTPAGADRRLIITSPGEQQTLWNIGGTLDVQVSLEPALQPGDHIDVLLDGQRVNVNATTPQFTVPDVYRGTHTLQAVVVDAKGQDLVRSLPVTFIVQQTSVLNPNNNTPPAQRGRVPGNN